MLQPCSSSVKALEAMRNTQRMLHFMRPFLETGKGMRDVCMQWQGHGLKLTPLGELLPVPTAGVGVGGGVGGLGT